MLAFHRPHLWPTSVRRQLEVKQMEAGDELCCCHLGEENHRSIFIALKYYLIPATASQSIVDGFSLTQSMEGLDQNGHQKWSG